MTAGTGFFKVNLYLFITAKYGFLKCNPNRSLYVGAPRGTAPGPPGPAAAKNITKNIAEDITHIPAEVKAAEAAAKAARTGSALFKRSMAELVVLLTFLRVT